MGWAVLYIAFGIVALWLLGEVLLQYKARLRWRLLAFVGFLGVVVGVLIPSVVVIGLGAAAFAVGQTYVTLSFRSGFSAGWAMNAPMLGGSKRRRGERGRQEPTLEVSGLETADGGYGDDAADYRRDTSAPAYGQDDDYDRDDVFTPARPVHPTAAETTAVYEPQPVPDDTGSYGVYGDTGYPQGPAPAHDQYAATAQGTDQSYGYDYSGYGQQQGYDATDQQQYAAYSDPYIGTPTYGGASYDTSYGDQQYYAQQGYGQDQYTGTYGGDSPPGGVWVPQQRDTDEYGQELPPEQQPYPHQGNGQQQTPGNGFDEQYRF
ncbi:SCO2102 family sporulation regulator [Streptomyces swartbergensis]|uniref:SCO2102 family sporulation regulator n=1 Tax=Streptomyces swartbergensis TaxID=487165 RepID=UPI0038190D05